MTADNAHPARETIQLLRRLRAVRNFRPDPIPYEALEDILEVARWTGSARNEQPWTLIVVEDVDNRRALAACEGFARHLAEAPLGIALVFDNAWPEGDTYDDGRLSERIMLAAAAHGLASCIGWWKGEGRDAARALLGAPASSTVRTIISIGYRDDKAHHARPKQPRPRKPLSEIVSWEYYGASRG